MLKLVIPLVLGLIGAGGGIAAGLYLKPEPKETAAPGPCGDGATEGAPGVAADATAGHGTDSAVDAGTAADAGAGHGAAGHNDNPVGSTEFVKLNNQFVVPVLDGDRIVSLVVLSLSLETPLGGSQVVFQREPKLRDAFLQVLFDHANSGGFSGAFTAGDRLPFLRKSLLTAARMALGPTALDVLVTDIARQDV